MTSEFISVSPDETELPTLHQYLLASVAPRPIAWVSTMDAHGNPNLAPFSFYNVVSGKPPLLIFSPNRSGRTGQNKDTVPNILETMEAVIHVVPHALVEQANLSAFAFAKGVNEFTKAGLTALPSDIVKPFRIKESPVQMECKVEQVIVLGAHGGSGNIILCRVVKIHIHTSVLSEGNIIDPYKLDLVSRMGKNYYCRASGDSLFEMPKYGLEPCIGIDLLPEFIRNSSVFTGNTLGKLGSLLTIPTEEQILQYAQMHPKYMEMSWPAVEQWIQESLTTNTLQADESLSLLLAWKQKNS